MITRIAFIPLSKSLLKFWSCHQNRYEFFLLKKRITQKVNLLIISQSLECKFGCTKMNKKQNPTDRFLISQYMAGNTSMLPILVKRYHKIFCEKAFWITKDKEIAKDIAQESWIAIIDKLQTLKNVDSFKSWAFRIVYTCLLYTSDAADE